MLFSLDTDYIAQGTFTEKIAALAKAGFTHVNIRSNIIENLLLTDESEVDVIKKILRDYQLAVDWVHAPYECVSLHDYYPGCRAISMAALKKCIEIAASLQANSLVIHPISSNFPAHLSVRELEKYEEQLADSFKKLVLYAEQKGILIASENLNDKYGTSVLLYLLEHIPQLGMCFDTGHAQLTDAWNMYLPNYTRRIIALHLQDTSGQYDEHLAPGDGSVDFPRFMRTLMDSGYCGVWGCESVYSASRDMNKTAEELAVKIYNRLMRFVQTAVEQNVNTGNLFG